MGNVIVLPSGGLANKLRAIISTKVLANYLGYDHFITNWIETNDKPGFDTVFQTGADYKILPDPLDYIKLNPYTDDFHLDYLKTLGDILINTLSTIRIPNIDQNKWLTEYLNEYQNLQLIQTIQDQIPDVPLNTIGLHIRRGDNQESINESPTELFIRVIESNKNTPIFLSTDDIDLEKSIIRDYPNVQYQPKTAYHTNNRIVRPDIRMPEDTTQSKIILTQSLIEAVIDLYVLSKCQIIYGSHYSTFSEIASALNKNRLIVLKK